MKEQSLKDTPESAYYPLYVGIYEGRPIYMDLAKQGSVLIGGTTGCGAPCQPFFPMIHGLSSCGNKDKIQILLISEYGHSIPRLQDHIQQYSYEVGQEVISSLLSELTKRDTVNASPRPICICFVDDFSRLVKTDKRAELQITQLLAKGQKKGLFLVLATEKPTLETFTPLIQANAPTRICFGNDASTKRLLECESADCLTEEEALLSLADSTGLYKTIFRSCIPKSSEPIAINAKDIETVSTL